MLIWVRIVYDIFVTIFIGLYGKKAKGFTTLEFLQKISWKQDQFLTHSAGKLSNFSMLENKLEPDFTEIRRLKILLQNRF